MIILILISDLVQSKYKVIQFKVAENSIYQFICLCCLYSLCPNHIVRICNFLRQFTLLLFLFLARFNFTLINCSNFLINGIIASCLWRCGDRHIQISKLIQIYLFLIRLVIDFEQIYLFIK